jgi:glutamyl-tRNA synthetase
LAFLVEPDEVVAGRYPVEELLPKKADAAATADALARARDLLAELAPPDFAAEELERRCRDAAEAQGWKAGDFFKPIRVAITGRSVSPPLFGSMEMLGQERCLARIDAALRALRAADGTVAAR